MNVKDVHEPVRFQYAEGEEIVFDDMIRGRVQFRTEDIGDFIIVKSNGDPNL